MHLHRGTCGDPGSDPLRVLEDVRNEDGHANAPPPSSVTVVDIPLERLDAEGVVIDVHQSHAVDNVVLCGEIPGDADEETALSGE